MTRKVDVNFATNERLFRSVAKDAMDAGGKVKAQKLRLQISVAREKYGPAQRCVNPSYPHINGIVSIEAGQAHGLMAKDITTASATVVDEPLPDQDEHALISLVAVPGTIASDEETDKVRAAVAAKMIVHTAPTKV